MTLTDTRTRVRNENTGTATTSGGKKLIRRTPNVDKFIDLLTENPSMTGQTDLSAAADPETRMQMARTVVTCAGMGNARVNDCLLAVGREVPGVCARLVVDGVLERAVAAA